MSQENETPQENKTTKWSMIEISTWAEDPPLFPGGKTEMDKFIRENLKVADSLSNRSAIISFVVEPDGSLTNITIARTVEKSFDEECLRVIRLMPKWTPGKTKGKPVRSKYNIVVRKEVEPSS